jgi:hypothetical protein
MGTAFNTAVVIRLRNSFDGHGACGYCRNLSFFKRQDERMRLISDCSFHSQIISKVAPTRTVPSRLPVAAVSGCAPFTVFIIH